MWRGWAAALMAMSTSGVIAMNCARAQSTPEWIYTMKPGDNPWSIAQTWLIDMKYWPLLQRRNGVVDPNRMPPGTQLKVPVNWLKTEPARAAVHTAAAQGCVLQSTPPRPLVSGDVLEVGSVLLTSATGYCGLEFPDSSRVLLQSSSEMSLDRMISYTATGMYDIALRLVRGRAQSNVTPASGPASRFEISSPQGVTSVRGTRYRVAVADTDSRAEVLEGLVEVGNSLGKVTLPPGTGSLFKADGPPSDPVMLLVRPDLSHFPSDIPNRSRSFAFPAVPGAKGYRHLLWTNPEFTALAHDVTSPTPDLNVPVLSPGIYQLQSRAIDAHGLEGHDAAHRFHVFAQLPAATTCEPRIDARVSVSRTILRCDAVAQASYYRFQIARDAAFTRIETDSLEREPAHDVAIKGFGLFYWRMAAHDQVGRPGEFTEPSRFTRRLPAPAVELTELGRASITFGWLPLGSEYVYRLQVSEDPTFANPQTDHITKGDRLVVPRPPHGQHYARVGVAEIGTQAFEFGDPHAFNIPASRPWEWLGPAGLLFLFAL